MLFPQHVYYMKKILKNKYNGFEILAITGAIVNDLRALYWPYKTMFNAFKCLPAHYYSQTDKPLTHSPTHPLTS